MKNLIVFASGREVGGGTGFENLAKRLPHRVLAVVSNHKNGAVRERADALSIPFFCFLGPYDEEGYHLLIQKICTTLNVEYELWYALSGWFKWVYWLPATRTFNIHPATLPRFAGIYGENLHKAVWEAWEKGEIQEGEIIMQFVSPKSYRYDEGPIFFRYPFSLSGIESYESYRAVVRTLEHFIQPLLTELVIRREISWNGTYPVVLKIPKGL